jgi:hypothetical protein
MTYSNNILLDNIEPSGKENVGAFRCYWYLILGISFFSTTTLIGNVWGISHVFVFVIGIIGLVLSFLWSIKTWSLSMINSYKVSLGNVFYPPGIALFAKNLEFYPSESQGPITILAFIKFGQNSALFNKVWKRLLGNQ